MRRERPAGLNCCTERKKRPGRPAGHPGAYRPVPDHVDEEAEVPLTGCPCCGGPLAAVEAVEQFIEDLPPPRPHVTRLVTYKGACPRCGATLPLQERVRFLGTRVVEGEVGGVPARAGR